MTPPSLKTGPFQCRVFGQLYYTTLTQIIIALKKSTYTESQVLFALHQAETGTPVGEVCRKMGIGEAAIFYNWNKKSGGRGTSELHGEGWRVNHK